jgi:hypothetical protein
VSAGAALTPGLDTLIIAGLTPDVSIGLDVEPGSDTLVIEGYAPDISISVAVQVSPSELTITGHAPALAILIASGATIRIEEGAVIRITLVESGNDFHVDEVVGSDSLTVVETRARFEITETQVSRRVLA